jgi:hypothetical protein
MLAAKRNDRVRGRTKILDVSISTRKGFSHTGAPSGNRCATVARGAFVDLDKIILIHIGRPRVSVKMRCLDILNIYGSSPNRLINKIVAKIEDKIVLSPFS